VQAITLVAVNQHHLQPTRIAGGGLSGLLLLAAIKHHDPKADVLLFERSSQLSRRHTWSFHGHDVPAASWAWLEPLISHSWEGYRVKFPGYERSFTSRYHSIRAEKLAEWIEGKYASSLRMGEEAPAGAVLTTGWPALPPGAEVGYQKFWGLHVRTKEAHGLTTPLLMDATVNQEDGYRFFYLLPWSSHELLAEDTYYADGPTLEQEKIRAEITRYLEKNNFGPFEIIHEESGALPLPFHEISSAGPVALGAAAGIFHPVTGYTVPHTLRQIEAYLGANLLATQAMMKAELKFYYFLNRMLFRSAGAAGRRRVLERFYRLPEPLIQNFYAGKLSLAQKIRLLAGKPPVRLSAAIKEIFR
jgi:lycopene beta-cyclase